MPIETKNRTLATLRVAFVLALVPSGCGSLRDPDASLDLRDIPESAGIQPAPARALHTNPADGGVSARATPAGELRQGRPGDAGSGALSPGVDDPDASLPNAPDALLPARCAVTHGQRAPELLEHPSGFQLVALGGSTRFAAGDSCTLGNTQLSMRHDGNLVLSSVNGAVRWMAGTVGRGDYADFQPDGNLVVYDRSGMPAWSSYTCCRQNALLAVQADGNLVIYDQGWDVVWWGDVTAADPEAMNDLDEASEAPVEGSLSADAGDDAGSPRAPRGSDAGSAPEATATCSVARYERAPALLRHPFGVDLFALYGESVLSAGDTCAIGKVRLAMQDDGNLVLYDESARARWTSGTIGRGAYAKFQRDGNLVVYDHTDEAVWSLYMCCWSDTFLAVQADGNLVIYDDAWGVYWSSETYR